MIIDCDTCVVRDVACDDCVISVLLSSPRLEQPPPTEAASYVESHFDCVESDNAIEFNSEEERAVVALAAFGLVPPLRLVDSQSGQAPGFQSQDDAAPGGLHRQHIA
jgi:hypothetical protein